MVFGECERIGNILLSAFPTFNMALQINWFLGSKSSTKRELEAQAL